MIYIKTLCFLLIASQLTFSILGCDYRTLDAEAKRYVHNIWVQGSIPVRKETIKDHLYFLTDEEKIDKKYKEADNFNKLCNEIKSQIKNVRFLDFLTNCQSIYYDGTSDPEEKYATHILLEAVKNRFEYEWDDFKKLNAFHERERVVHAFKDMNVSAK